MGHQPALFPAPESRKNIFSWITTSLCAKHKATFFIMPYLPDLSETQEFIPPVSQ